MASSKSVYSEEYWKAKVQEWISSGKSAKAWCQENKVVYTTFLGWRDRLKFRNTQAAVKKNALDNHSSKAHFIELKNQQKNYPDILLECEGVKIHLSPEFDAASLKKCLNVLRGLTC